MGTENPFLLPEEEYQQDIDIVKAAVRQLSLYASRTLGKPFDVCYNHLWKKLRNKEIPFHNPEVVFYERTDGTDREKKVGTWLGYLKSIKDNREIIVPTATSYLPTDVAVSDIAEYIGEKKDRRKKFKKISQKFEAAGDDEKFRYYHNAQDSAKRDNNAVSGNFVAGGSLINNPTGHSTLTSIIRTGSSLCNASNERLISGNRHYRTFDVTLNNMISIVSEADVGVIESVIQQYGLVYPSADDVIAMVAKSSKKYWVDQRKMQTVKDFIQTLSPVERAAVMYTGDLYHIRKLNEEFMFSFVNRLSSRGTTAANEDPIKVIRTSDEAIVNYAHQINISMLEGKGKEYEKLTVDQVNVLANTCKSIVEAVEFYKPFFRAFFLTKNSPCTIATILDMEREAVVLSDTDSTMFSVDEWVDWYFGTYIFTDDSYAVAGAVMFVATQSIAHILALLSANMNVARKHIFTLSFKPEYVFPVFAQTSVSKHYYAARKVREGDVYFGFKMEVKGVHLKSSTLPEHLTKDAADTMEGVIQTIMDGNRIDLAEHVKKVARIERDIESSIKSGEVIYLRRSSIKPADGYKEDEDRSPYQWYKFWLECLEPTYGYVDPPPYVVTVVPLTLKSPKMVADWISSIKDPALADRLRIYFARTGRKRMLSLQLPRDYCASSGVPDVFHDVMDIRKITLAMTKPHRNVLESIGFFPKYETRLIDQGY